MNRKISKGIIISLFSQLIAILVGLLYTPIMIRIVGQSEYGLYQLVQSFVNFLALLNLGFNGAYIKYYVSAMKNGGEEEVAKINGMFLKAFLILSVLCAAVGSIFVYKVDIISNSLTQEEYALARILMIFMIVNMAVSFPNNLFVGYIFANEEFVFYKIVAIILNIVSPALSLLLLNMGFGSVGLVATTLTITVLGLIVNIIFSIKKLNFKANIKYFDKAVFLELVVFSSFIFLSDLIDQLNSNVDKILLGRMIDTNAVAIYAVAYNLNHYRVILSWIVPEMFVPQVNKAVIQDCDEEKTNNLFIQTGRINNFLMLIVISGFCIFGKFFVELWVGSEYELAYYGAIILMLAGYISSVQTIGVNVQNAKNLHKARSAAYLVIVICNIIISIFFIKKWGIIGTCLGTLVASVVGNGVFMNIYYHKRIKLNVFRFWKSLIIWIIVSIGLTVGAYFIVKNIDLYSWWKLIVGIACYSVVYCVLLFFIGLNRNERNYILSKIRRNKQENVNY